MSVVSLLKHVAVNFSILHRIHCPKHRRPFEPPDLYLPPPAGGELTQTGPFPGGQVSSAPLPSDFLPGMEAGECTVVVKQHPPDHPTRSDIMELFSQFGHIFKTEADAADRCTTRLLFADKKHAQGAVMKFSNFMHESSGDAGSGVYARSFKLQASLLGSDIFVGELDRSVTEVKLRRGEKHASLPNANVCVFFLFVIHIAVLILFMDFTDC